MDDQLLPTCGASATFDVSPGWRRSPQELARRVVRGIHRCRERPSVKAMLSRSAFHRAREDCAVSDRSENWLAGAIGPVLQLGFVTESLDVYDVGHGVIALYASAPQALELH